MKEDIIDKNKQIIRLNQEINEINKISKETHC